MMLWIAVLLCVGILFSDAEENLTFSEDWSNGINYDLWTHELTLSGSGNWEFEYYTNNRTNSYVVNNTLYINPTLTAERYDISSAWSFIKVVTISCNTLFC